MHKLVIHFFLMDDTVEILETILPNSGIDSGTIFLKKIKLPKVFKNLPGPGEEETSSLLNVLPTGFLKGRYAIDPIMASTTPNYYRQVSLR